MFFYRRWFLIGCALVLGGGQILAASREQRDFAAAVAAFHDQFYDRAAAGLTQFLQTYRKSTNAPAATLLLAQSEVHLGQSPAAIARLADTNNLARAKAAGLADQYVYWRAEAQFAGGEVSDAAHTFVALTREFPDSPLALTATVEAAAAYEKLGRWPRVDDLLDRTNGIFERAAQRNPASAIVANGRLLLSESKCAQTNFAAALQVLDLLNPATLTPEQAWQRARQLYRANLRLDRLDAALAATTNLLAIARTGQGGVWATNLAESVACRAGVLEKLGRLAAASAAWQENLTNSAPADEQQQAVLKMAELAEAQNNLTNAEAGLENFLAQFTNAPAAGIARLTLGELYLKDFLAQPAGTNALVAAQTNFDNLLAAVTNGPLAGKAHLDRGWCDWLAAQYPESLADFQAAAQMLPRSPDQAVARFKTGDAQFALTNFAGARAAYEAVLADYTNLPAVEGALGEQALYQCLRANLALNDAAGATATLHRILKAYPEGDLSDNAILLVAEKTDDARQPAVARGLLEQFEARYPHSELLPQARMAVARTYEQEQNWPAAITTYESWRREFPTNALRPRIEYLQALANYRAGNESNALAQFTAFLNEFPTNALAPLAHWWVADYYYRLGGTNLVAAEGNYELISQDFPTNALASPALLMAGRAAMDRFQPSDASHYFVTLINDTNSPADLVIQAKFGYCEALQQTASADPTNTDLQLATNILGQIYQAYPTNEAGALAWSETGDCDLQLGALDAATNAYAQAFSAPAAKRNPELWCRAKVGLGLVLEKKADQAGGDAQAALWTQARDQYLDVLDSVRAGSAVDPFWAKKAGLQALALIEKIGTPNPNRFMDDLETLFPQLKGSLEKKRAAVRQTEDHSVLRSAGS